MKKRPPKPFRMAPLQKLSVRPIEDPAEQAALDELLKRAEASAAGVVRPENGSPGAKGAGDKMPR